LQCPLLVLPAIADRGLLSIDRPQEYSHNLGSKSNQTVLE
jgi:hypothetical protein